MQAEIKGGTTPILEVSLSAGDEVVAEAGELAWLRGPVQLTTGRGVGQQQGGLFGAAKRAMSGGTYFMTSYSVPSGSGSVVFAAKAPGEIREIEVGPGKEWVVHRHGFMCCEPGVELNLHLQQKLGAGIFGGAGFVLQRLSGRGKAFVESHGDVVEVTLGAGEQIRVHPGHLALFDAGVGLELTTVPGIRNKLFGGDGLFLAQLTGPGLVWLQSITLAGLAHALQPYLETQSAAEGGAAGAIIGGLLKS